MTRPELIDDLFQLILQRLEPEFAPEEKVEHTESTTLEELGFDSLAKIDIVLVVETHFKVKVSREQLGNIKTVGDIADVLLTLKPSICDKTKE
jgi:acyl carrier protein